MGTEVSKVKQILRGQMRQALAELSDQERAWSDGELIQRFLDHPKLAQAQTVMLYYGVGHEIRTEGLIQTLLDQGKTVCLPKCLPENQMEARAITSLEDLAGKTVAYSSGTSSEVILTNALNSVGLTMDDITAMDMDASSVVTAMLSGGVDACAIWSPQIGRAHV